MSITNELLKNSIGTVTSGHELKVKIEKMGYSFPNIRSKVMDLEICWNVIAQYNGWKVEQHILTEHARLLDPYGYRVAWGYLSDMEKILKSIIVPYARCKIGDVLAIARKNGLFYHFAIYIGNGRVIHYASETGDIGSENYIHEADFSEFLRNDVTFYILQFDKLDKAIKDNSLDIKEMLFNLPYSLSDYHIYSPEETISRARSRIGESDYSLVKNNCEHFAIWAKTGINESKQVKLVLRLLFGQIPFIDKITV